MNRDEFKKLNENIRPSASLIEQTKHRMRTEKRKVKNENLYESGGMIFMRNFSRKFAATAAGFVMVIAIGVNASSVVAAELSDIPFIGKIANVLTFREYSEIDDDKEVNVNEPVVVENGVISAEEVNAIIQGEVDKYVEDAKKRVDEYKEAFLATGGTEKEFAEKGIKITVDHEIKAQTEDYLSFVVKGYENWVSAYTMNIYCNYDMKTGEKVALKDLLGEDYINVANESIKNQMAERENAGEIEYFDEDMNGFTTITDETNFYINENGNPVVVFDKYEIAPGAYGEQEFEIVK